MAQIEIKTHRERPIPPRSIRELFEHVGWSRTANEQELREVLEAGPAVAAWDGERLVGFVRALSDGHLAAYIEDVMGHQDYRRGGVGDRLISRLLGEIKQSAPLRIPQHGNKELLIPADKVHYIVCDEVERPIDRE